jgi:hypothetical protein
MNHAKWLSHLYFFARLHCELEVLRSFKDQNYCGAKTEESNFFTFGNTNIVEVSFIILGSKAIPREVLKVVATEIAFDIVCTNLNSEQ